MIYPEFPKKGDTIGICAPSAGVGHKLESFDLSLDAFRERGYEIKETASVRNDGDRSNTAVIRGDEFNSLVSDNTTYSVSPDGTDGTATEGTNSTSSRVAAVIAASGGDYNLEVLPYIDWSIFESWQKEYVNAPSDTDSTYAGTCANETDTNINKPIWIGGASDPTNIVYPITTKYDIATLYGFNAGSFDARPLHEFQRNALDILSGVSPAAASDAYMIPTFVQHSFDYYDSSRDFSAETAVYDEPVFWTAVMPTDEPNRRITNCKELLTSTGSQCPGSSQSEENTAVQSSAFNNEIADAQNITFEYDANISVDVSGRLIGGCIDCIDKIIGTPYDGTAEFVSRYDDIIWYFDVFAMGAYELYLSLLRMKHCGFFRNTRGVIFGRVMFPGDSTDEQYLEHLSRLFDVPIIWNADIGHVKPCMTLINGSAARIRTANGKGTIEMELI